jgi:hypothetical protein
VEVPVFRLKNTYEVFQSDEISIKSQEEEKKVSYYMIDPYRKFINFDCLILHVEIFKDKIQSLYESHFFLDKIDKEEIQTKIQTQSFCILRPKKEFLVFYAVFKGKSCEFSFV